MLREMNLSLRFNDESAVGMIESIQEWLEISDVVIEHVSGKMDIVNVDTWHFDAKSMMVVCGFDGSYLGRELGLRELNDRNNLSFTAFGSMTGEAENVWSMAGGLLKFNDSDQVYPVVMDEVTFEPEQAELISRRLTDSGQWSNPKSFSVTEVLSCGLLDKVLSRDVMTMATAILSCINPTSEHSIVRVEGKNRSELLGLLW
ncbi:hypothetical protein [Vibrio barjaei]|uniref:hypothetical protein n=1 Tax=Vibrio barjaei TaxID=1676683 RepID=UPI0022848957|nr:hypothetical protein [Vibrio barjaei]MCY9874787.1 hypothetical protein [Vibrio barjaei]